MADAKDTPQASELDIIEGRAENLGEPVKVDLDDNKGGGQQAAEPSGKKPAGEEPEPQAKSEPDEAMESLRRQVAAERSRREAAEARGRDYDERIRRAETENQAHQASIIESNLREAEHERALAKRAYADAYTSGDAEKVADAADRLTAATSRFHTYNDAKAELDRGRGRRPHEGAVVPREPERRVEHDPVEAFASGLPGPTAAWVRAHPECVTDPTISASLTYAHMHAVHSGHAEGSPEYLASIESTLWPKRAAEPEPAPRRQEPELEQRRNGSAAAPVRGSASQSSQGNGGRRTVTLTPQQREAADMMDMSYQDYARHMLALENEGRIGNKRMN